MSSWRDGILVDFLSSKSIWHPHCGSQLIDIPAQKYINARRQSEAVTTPVVPYSLSRFPFVLHRAHVLTYLQEGFQPQQLLL